jgi:glycosyltransferase involved in cell wall biosynthesis
MGFKIGFITGEYPPMEGGVGAFTQELARELANNGHDIHIFTSKKARPKDEKRSLWDLKEPYEIGYAKLHAHVARWRWGAMNSVAAAAARFDLDIVNIQYQAIAYDMHFPAINFLPWRMKEISLVIATFHDLRVPYLFPKAGRLRRGVVNHLARSADGVICTNQEDAQSLKEIGIKDDRLELIPIGSNISLHKPSEDDLSAVRYKLGLKPTDNLIAFFGFINPSKGADTLLLALAALPDNIHLVFIGGATGSSDAKGNQLLLDELHKIIRELDLGGRVHWSGFLPDRDVSAYLNAAEVVVMPYRDGVSLRRGTLMAVLAHGRPLITTKPFVPIPELIHGENVWLTPIDAKTALSQSITAVLSDFELQKKLSRGALKLSSLYSWNVIAERTTAFYSKIISKKNL